MMIPSDAAFPRSTGRPKGCVVSHGALESTRGVEGGERLGDCPFSLVGEYRSVLFWKGLDR